MNTTPTTPWVLYPWFDEHGEALVHPDDLSRFRALLPYGKVFANLGADGDYVRLLCGSDVYRVKPTHIMTHVCAPAFVYGQAVRVKKNGTNGTVNGIQWHHSHQKPFFLLDIDGKRPSKRFWEEDLEPAS